MNKLQSEFHDDLSRVAIMAKGYVVREVYEKWKDRLLDLGDKRNGN